MVERKGRAGGWKRGGVPGARHGGLTGHERVCEHVWQRNATEWILVQHLPVRQQRVAWVGLGWDGSIGRICRGGGGRGERGLSLWGGGVFPL